MSNSIFCPNCGMLKSNCICGQSKTKKFRSSLSDYKKDLNDFGSYDDNNFGVIDSSYSIEENSLPKYRIDELKREFPEINSKIIEAFPFETPREGQFDIITDIVEAIDKGFKYIILEAGTGTGKSAIATTLARMYGSAYILTMTKQLQAQYSDEFNFPLVKGRGNFNCLNDNLDSTCDIGTCKTTPNSKKFFCPFGVGKSPTLGAVEAFEDSFGNALFYASEEHCHYWQQKTNAVNSSITLMNYDYGILELNYVKHFGIRDLLILDEAHNIENKLMRTLELNLYNKSLQKDIKKVISNNTLKSSDPKDWILELEAIYDAYQEIDRSELPKNKVERIQSTSRRLKQLRNNLEKEPRNWVIDVNDSGVSFKPLKINHYAKDYLFNYGEVCIFLSATILSHKMFSKWLGLNPNEVYHIKVDSPFPPSKRPIELKLAGKMAANRIKQTAPKTIPILNKILERHKNDKGLIHTNSYKCQNYVTKNILNSRLISHTSQNRESVLHHFEDSPDPLVLVSPSMSEGVDLPYDKCRFQIIYKVPFPYLGDKQVNLRRKRDQRWYAYKTVMTLMQAYGRGMRAEDDSCYTYILDQDIQMLFTSPMYKSLVPEFFKEAIIETD
ncbi:helicase C-terminal domain-containing protein [Methanobrevibacter filiformis]|uniref:Bifunctional ATP-dependent DNA helicase/DNA polymerase III subunit epsilon n=1 Tax=Methanobrevibacter filiformis TaxID=55758 RepID=A0A166DZG4_9EURY|nr:ATP-dependent DNA helicase [Methanobrevibacter filiformis]KZX16115.1 bifunctional ATP-dependent DNA helicase/DNA polymerase III subunit epsilon [Methanobrevibacter filiformis]